MTADQLWRHKVFGIAASRLTVMCTSADDVVVASGEPRPIVEAPAADAAGGPHGLVRQPHIVI
jgi:hypothetical protein